MLSHRSRTTDGPLDLRNRLAERMDLSVSASLRFNSFLNVASAHFNLHAARAAILLLFVALFLCPPFVAAQGLDPAALLKPATDTWPTYNGDYSGRRFSPLAQINAANVKSLTLAWVFQAHSAAIKSTPLEVNGVLYFTVPDHVWAVDARTGQQIWHYKYTSDGRD